MNKHKGRLFQKLKIGVKDGDLGGRKKESCSLMAPESTKSGAKRTGLKDGEGGEGLNFKGNQTSFKKNHISWIISIFDPILLFLFFDIWLINYDGRWDLIIF